MYISQRVFYFIVICSVVIGSLSLGCSKMDSKAVVSSNLESWIGQYLFSEFTPPDENKFYSVSIYKESDDYFGDINIDGFQEIQRMKAKVTGNEELINIVFEEYLPDNISEPYKKGDVLLKFEKNDSDIYTSWGKIEPMLGSNKKSGGVYFRKLTDNESDKINTQEYVNFDSIDKTLEESKENIDKNEVSKENKDDSKIYPPQKYVDFIKSKDKDPTNEILFYENCDIDLDGNNETIIASGYSDIDPTLTYVSQLYILRDNNGYIEQLGNNLAESGYAVYDVKVLQIQDMPRKYIYCGLTNGVNLLGFEVYELVDSKPQVLCYSASGTGSGDDEIRDFNNDGQYDGYVQNRSSYDVLYYPLYNIYRWEKDKFVLKNTSVEIPEYPKEIKDVIVQYLSLKVIDTKKSKEVNNRLSEMSSHEREFNIPQDIWYTAVYNTIQEFDNGIQFDINENNNSAGIVATYVDEENEKYKITFHMNKVEDRWCIDNIEYH